MEEQHEETANTDETLAWSKINIKIRTKARIKTRTKARTKTRTGYLHLRIIERLDRGWLSSPATLYITLTDRN